MADKHPPLVDRPDTTPAHEEVQARRAFLKKVGRASAAAPAAALLISAAARPTEGAAQQYDGGCACGCAACVIGGEDAGGAG